MKMAPVRRPLLTFIGATPDRPVKRERPIFSAGNGVWRRGHIDLAFIARAPKHHAIIPAHDCARSRLQLVSRANAIEIVAHSVTNHFSERSISAAPLFIMAPARICCSLAISVRSPGRSVSR